MEKTKFGFSQANVPAPVWFRKGKKIFSNLENFVIAILMFSGYASDSMVLLIIKLSSNFLLENIEILLGNGQAYIPSNEEIGEKDKSV